MFRVLCDDDDGAIEKASAWWRADIVKYHGCLILIHTGGVTVGGRAALGSYEIVADSIETAVAFAARDITRLYTLIDARDFVHPHDESSGKPSIDRHQLVDMAKCEIDLVLESAF